MKLILIHGDDIGKSRSRLQKFIDSARGRNIEVVKIDCAKESLREKMSANTLFETKKLYILENLGKATKKDLDWLGTNADLVDDTVVVYLTSKVNATLKKSLPLIEKDELYELPNEIWKFLDSVYPGNTVQSLTLFHELLKNKPAEFVLPMLSGHLKDLYYVSIDEKTFGGSQWRIAKLKSQLSKFEGDKLTDLIHSLAEIDILSKTTSDSLADLLDFVIIDNLE